MRNLTSILLVVLITLGFNRVAGAQDLVYRPINPAFGGDTFNYQWLLNSAQEQNDYKEKSEYSAFNDDPLKQFEQDLNRQILSQLSRRLFANAFGEDGLNEGTYEIGGFQIEIGNYPDGVHINILDVTKGGETSIIVPYF